MNFQKGLIFVNILTIAAALSLLTPYIVTTQGLVVTSHHDDVKKFNGQYETIDIDQFTGDALPMLENSNTANFP